MREVIHALGRFFLSFICSLKLGPVVAYFKVLEMSKCSKEQEQSFSPVKKTILRNKRWPKKQEGKKKDTYTKGNPNIVFYIAYETGGYRK